MTPKPNLRPLLEMHDADLVYAVFTHAGQSTAIDVANDLGMKYAHCTECNSDVPMDVRDTSCVFCGRQLKDPVFEYRESCDVNTVCKDSPISEVWTQNTGGNIMVSYVIMRGGRVIGLSEDSLTVYKDVHDLIKEVEGTTVEHVGDIEL